MKRISGFWRGMVIIAAISAGVVVLDAQQTLITASILVGFVFYIAIAVVLYFLWRDFGRREIMIWPPLQQRVFYSAVGLVMVDFGWYFTGSLVGRNLLAFFVVAAICIYAAVRTWREQHRYS